MNILDENKLKTIIGGTNWGKVGNACFQGATDDFTSAFNWKSALIGCVKSATQEYGKQHLRHRRRHH